MKRMPRSNLAKQMFPGALAHMSSLVSKFGYADRLKEPPAIPRSLTVAARDEPALKTFFLARHRVRDTINHDGHASMQSSSHDQRSAQ